ncbi:hypothetical protein OEB99_18365 [Actinotalea sp. M2MS4P-6]|uniref:hypothetical protein n=1 Tax=Actinotalea sp. M2MS4P-6 TaxID=2983762 RepID=UPI0021E4D686|nr:hypothetical protein [Actinotalea sp. M2MS4P-6]MCV2396279.1 hypothetical protein [Actinotalea sp. M2MS4P-6]
MIEHGAPMAGAWYTDLVDSGRAATIWLLLGFVVTFGVTRWVTVTIRRRAARGGGSGSAIKDVHIGGVHVHHQVWGILLVLLTGVLELRFRPGSPWLEVLALLFGAGAALALDEFALWLHLEDVYWTEEGRKSIDAVLIAVVVGAALLAGTSPVGVGSSDVAETGWGVVAVGIVIHTATTVTCLLKGKVVMGLVGLPLPGIALVGAVRLARPESFWARRLYRERKMARATERYRRAPVRRGGPRAVPWGPARARRREASRDGTERPG